MADQKQRELQQQIQRLLEELARKDRLALEERELAEKERERAEKERERREKERQLRFGKFFASFDEVWCVRPVEPNVEHFTVMFRPSHPSVDGYAITMLEARNPFSTAAKESRSASGDRATVWPRDVLAFQVQGFLAHLVPAGATKASLYHDIAKWVFGVPDEDEETVQKLIHGSRRNLGIPRTAHTGLKHFPCNRILLRSQSFFDGDNAGLLIVPILSLDEVKNWNGEGYQAIFMIAPMTRKAFASKSTSITEVASTVGLHLVDPQPDHYATMDELEASRKLLEQFLLAIGYSLWESLPLTTFSTIEQHALRALQDGSILPDATRRVLVPQWHDRADIELRVWKVDLGLGEDFHPAPDPMLLTVKAANVWSTFHDQKLVAEGSLKEQDEDDSDDDMRLAWCESIAADERRKELTGMSACPLFLK